MATQYTAGLSAGQVLTAATMNSIGAAWETWTPTITQVVNLTYAIDYAKYGRINNLVYAAARFNPTSTGTYGNGLYITFPIQCAGNAQIVGNGFFYDASANNVYNLSCLRASATQFIFYADLTGASGVFGGSPALSVASGDQIRVGLYYEAA